MTNLNNVVLEGRLVRDAADGYRKSKSGDSCYGSFTIAVNRSSKDASGEWKDETSYIDCKGFGKRYDYAVPKMTKGTLVRVVGKLQQERWQSDDGQNKQRIVVVVDEYYVDHGKGGGSSEGSAPARQQEQPAQTADGFPEDIPF